MKSDRENTPLGDPGQGVGRGNGWQPIETAPKDGTAFLACWLGLGGQPFEVVNWDDEANEWIAFGHAVDRPTHWMPLPPLPTARTAIAKARGE